MVFLRKVPQHLPKAKGKYLPGCMDIMLKYSKDGQFMRCFYPTDVDGGIKQYSNKWTPVVPEESYIIGFAKVLMIWQVLLNTLIKCYGKLFIPALYGEKIREQEKYKVIILSHGLGLFRSMFSAVSIELASRGYIVFVLEHRDESACSTYYYTSQEDVRMDKKTYIPFKTYNMGDKEHYNNRNKQVNYRAEECCKALDFILELNNGIVPYNVINDLPSSKDISFKLDDLVGRIDTDSITMVGQSFGGASALLALSKRHEFRQGILLDPWMFPIKEENLVGKIKQPLLFINTQTFHIAQNVKAMEKYVNGEDDRRMRTMLQTTHENQSDTVFLVGSWLNWFMRKIDPKIGIRLNNSFMLQFLRDKTGHTEDISDCEEFINQHDKQFYTGITKAWA